MNNLFKAFIISTATLSTQVIADINTQSAFSNLEPASVSQEAILSSEIQARPVVHSIAFEGLEPAENNIEQQLTDSDVSFSGNTLIATLEPVSTSKEALL